MPLREPTIRRGDQIRKKYPPIRSESNLGLIITLLNLIFTNAFGLTTELANMCICEIPSNKNRSLSARNLCYGTK